MFFPPCIIGRSPFGVPLHLLVQLLVGLDILVDGSYQIILPIQLYNYEVSLLHICLLNVWVSHLFKKIEFSFILLKPYYNNLVVISYIKNK